MKLLFTVQNLKNLIYVHLKSVAKSNNAPEFTSTKWQNFITNDVLSLQKSDCVVDKIKPIEQNKPIDIPPALQFACQPLFSICSKFNAHPSTAISLTFTGTIIFYYWMWINTIVAMRNWRANENIVISTILVS